MTNLIPTATTTSTDTLNREAWLNAAAVILVNNHLLPAIAASNYELPQPLNYKLTMSFPLNSKKAIGQCFTRAVSAGGFNEILINPTQADSVEVLAILLHELVHAADDCKSGHKGFFRAIATGSGLAGKMTATHAGDALKESLLDLIDVLGDIPHSKMTLSARTKPKQKSRMIKMVCTSCDFNFRASQTQINRMTDNYCNVCNDTTMVQV